MTVGSLKHSNVLPQPAAGVGGGGGGVGVTGGSIQSAGRMSSHRSPARVMKPSSTICSNLFGSPDPIETNRICDRNANDERQRFINRYGFDTHTSSYVTSGASFGATATSMSVAGLHQRHH